ncbi:MAG: dNTP triphosphohydrolase [Muribaculaceae bacterium]|nr:dNTP triphosphohydrolase [Muribaculaceae bacterium]
MEWPRLISDKRLGMEEYHDPRRHVRSDFQRDYDRLIFSSPFRRLQNKTQVFPLPGSIFVHNRLTHSLEVSSVGRSMANEVMLQLMRRYSGAEWVDRLRDIGDIVATACLCHDLGNPPFGHSGEKTISTFFTEGEGIDVRPLLTPRQWDDASHFEGNANSFRLLTHRFEGRREGGFAMTYSALASVVKYPYGSSHANARGKFGFFESEEGIYRRVASDLGIPEISPGQFARHPLVWLVEAADDICYQVMDIEDSHRLKILSTAEVADLMLGFFEPTEQERMRRSMARLHDPNEQVAYMRSYVIGAMVTDCGRVFVENEAAILNGTATGSLIGMMQPRLHDAYATCSATAQEKIYRSPEVVDIEIAGNRIITYLLKHFIEAARYPERNFSRLLIEKVPAQYAISAADFPTRLQAVLDHVSGMTDVYALNLYRQLNGLTLPAV